MRTTILASLMLLPAVALVGCPQPANDEGAYCKDTATVLTMDEVSELGFSGADVLDNVEGLHDSTLTWTLDGDTTELIMDVLYDGGEARFIVSEAVYPDDGGMENDMEIICDDRVEIDVAVTLSTDDLVLDESWTVALRALDATAASFLLYDLDPTDFTGTYDFMAFDPAEWDEVVTSISAGVNADGAFGTMDETASKVEDIDGPDSAATASLKNIAEWPLAGTQ